MPYVMVDVESDGPIPGDNSMICFGAVIVEPDLTQLPQQFTKIQLAEILSDFFST